MCPIQVVFLALVAVSSTTCKAECPLWTTFNSTTGKCECGSHLAGVVSCNPDTLEISILRCYCMTYDEHTDTTEVGPCYFTCSSSRSPPGYEVWKIQTNNSHELDQEICGPFQRTGLLCAKCVNNHSLPVYSFSTTCTECLRSEFKLNLLKYLAVAFLPLTLFYIVIVVFKISILTGDFVAYVLACQVLMSPITIGSMYRANERFEYNILLSFFMFWNLDFFRLLYTPFCIHPDMTTLQVLALHYLVAVYPLFLIILTYTAVLLHDRYSIVVKIWRPVQLHTQRVEHPRVTDSSLCHFHGSLLCEDLKRILQPVDSSSGERCKWRSYQ